MTAVGKRGAIFGSGFVRAGAAGVLVARLDAHLPFRDFEFSRLGTDITERKRRESELRRFQKVTIDRELRMQELKREMAALRQRVGQ
jgi:hypothetical protein